LYYLDYAIEFYVIYIIVYLSYIKHYYKVDNNDQFQKYKFNMLIIFRERNKKMTAFIQQIIILLLLQYIIIYFFITLCTYTKTELNENILFILATILSLHMIFITMHFFKYCDWSLNVRLTYFARLIYSISYTYCWKTCKKINISHSYIR